MTDSLLFSHGPLNPTAKMPEKGAVVSSPVHRPPKDGPPGLSPKTLWDKQKPATTSWWHCQTLFKSILLWSSPHYRDLSSSRLYKAKQ